MTALNKQALREAAERAASDSWGYDRDEFNDAITPEVVLALLDELEAATPSPVSVPDMATVETTYPDVQTNWQDAKMYAEGWNACRAAMLQGADPAADNTNQQFESRSRGDK